MKTYRVEVLGCRTNQYEAEAFRNQLSQMGYRQALDGEAADLCIVNSCTVTESADSHSRHLIRDLKRHNPASKLVVTGCFAERNPQEVASISGVDLVVSNKDKETLLEQLFPEEEIPEFSIKNFEAHTRAFVKVQDGCNSFCTYCIIPYVRGRSRSRNIPDIVKECQDLITSGFQEIVLTGINIGDFDGGGTLADLIRAVDILPGLQRLRVSSIDPDEINEELQDVILHGKTTCHSMHIVLQAGSNVVLKRMNRKYTRQIFLETVRRLKHASPDFTVTTDIIVGFPGETETDFEETLAVMQEVQFAKVHMFPYSDRPRTKAATFQDKVPHGIIKTRKSRLLRCAEELSYKLRENYIGRKMKVLTEEKKEGNRLFGHTSNFLPVELIDSTVGANQIIEVELIENRADALLGSII
jgi:threonylcarbamoyladenosine tRNA methylthiotransferase MtaB